jgi:hypothetical protein
MAAPSDAKWLVFGGTGWIGGMVIDLLKAKGANVFAAKSRLENRADVARCAMQLCLLVLPALRFIHVLVLASGSWTRLRRRL